MDCFLCKKVVFDHKNTIVDLKTSSLGRVCNDCSEDWKEFCEYCKVLKKWDDIGFDNDGKVTCLSCARDHFKVCYNCELRGIFECSCNGVYCKFCAEKHFVQKFNEEFSRNGSIRKFKHQFKVYGTECHLPDFQPDYFKSLKKEYKNHKEYLLGQNITLSTIKRLADIYKFSIEVFQLSLNSSDPSLTTINLLSANFSSGNFLEVKRLVFLNLDQMLSTGTRIEDFCQYLVYFPADLTPEIAKSVINALSTHKNKFSSKYKLKLYKAWFNYIKKNKKKTFGKFIQQNWTQPASANTLQLLTLTSMFTKYPQKQDECIQYLLFYFQSSPELSFVYHSRAQLDPNLVSKSTSLFYSFQVILRFSDFSNEFLVQLMIEYIENLVQVDQNKAGLYYVKLLEECLLNRHKAFDALKEKVSTFIRIPTLVSKIQQLSSNPIQ